MCTIKKCAQKCIIKNVRVGEEEELEDDLEDEVAEMRKQGHADDELQ